MTIEEATQKYGMMGSFRTHSANNRVWWTGLADGTSVIFLSFDKKNLYNIYRDVPQKLTEEQLKIFIEDEPFWADWKGLI